MLLRQPLSPAARRVIRFFGATLLATAFAVAAMAQSTNGPLSFQNNFMVTGDYIVAGAQGMTSSTTTIGGQSYAKGTITVPDTNPGIKGATSVPPGARIVAAFLYWQTAEKTGTAPGSNGSGAVGYFRPTFTGGPGSPGYKITGAQLVSANNAPAWSSGGCSTGTTGKVVQTYRADVTGLLREDDKGNVLAGNTVAKQTYEVLLPSAGNATPLTFGATLVIIFRVIPADPASPPYPLNAIVIYDGSVGQTTSSPTMTQTLQGFYQASAAPISRMTQIVGSGQSNKYEYVWLYNGPKQPNTPPIAKALPSLYQNGTLPTFPGYYGNWDNPTWLFSPGNNPILEDSASVTTVITPRSSNPGCVTWGAVIVSTTVKNTDGDGILDVWKTNQGYCDAAWNEGSCSQGNIADPAWVDLRGAAPHQKDLFIQFDYLCSKTSGPDSCDTTGNNYSFDPRIAHADSVLASAFHQQGVQVHFNGWQGASSNGSAPLPMHAIPETTLGFGATDCNGALCPFPGQPGVVAWKAGFNFLKNELIDPSTGDATACFVPVTTPPTLPPPQCVPRFQHGRKDSYHYTMFAHSLGRIQWRLIDKTLTNITASGNSLTFTTSMPHRMVAYDTTKTLANNPPNSRVTITDAISSPSLNGTYKITSVPTNPSCSGNAPTGVNIQMPITAYVIGGGVVIFTAKNNLMAGEKVTVSGFSKGTYLNGNTFIVQGSDGKQFSASSNQAGIPASVQLTTDLGFGTSCQANTFTITLASAITAPTVATDPNLGAASGQTGDGSGYSDVGGGDSLITLGSWGEDGKNPLAIVNTWMHELGHSLGLTHGGFWYDTAGSFAPTVEPNCKPNFQSVMNYAFQFDLPSPHYSEQQLVNLDEKNIGSISKLTSDSSDTLFPAQWFGLVPNGNASPASLHCDGSPILPGDAEKPMYLTKGLTSSVPWSGFNIGAGTLDTKGSLDVNYNGKIDTADPQTLPQGLRGYDDWAHVDLRQVGGLASFSTAPGAGVNGGGAGVNGGGAGVNGGGAGVNGGGAGVNGGGAGVNGGGAGVNGGGAGVNGGGANEITHTEANATTRPPQNATATEDVSPRYIHIFWFPPTFGVIGQYNIYRLPPWQKVGDPPTFTLQIGDPNLKFHSADGDPHKGEYEFVDTTAQCNPNGYTYFVSAVLAGTTQESPGSNQVSTTEHNGPLTACYSNTPTPTVTLNDLAGIPNPAVQSGKVTISWTLPADNANDYTNSSAYSTNLKASSLSYVGPIPNNQGCMAPSGTPVALLTQGANGPVLGALASNYGISGNGFSIDLDTTNLAAGCYYVTLGTDSNQSETTTSTTALKVKIFVSDNMPHIDPSPLPDATVGIAYGPTTVLESGGTYCATSNTCLPGGAFQWSIGSVKWTDQSSVADLSGIAFQTNTGTATNGTLSGTPTRAGTYTFTAQVKDSLGNIGTQQLTLKEFIYVSTTAPPANPPFTPTTSLPDAIVGLTYNGAVYQSGGSSNGTTPFTWTVVGNTVNGGGITNGSAIPGLAFAANGVGVLNGNLTGVPTTPGTYTFSAMVMDSFGNVGMRTLSLTVHLYVSSTQLTQTQITQMTQNHMPFPAPNSGLPDGTVGNAINATIQQYGGVGNVNWSITNNHLPPNFTLTTGNGGNGVLAGTACTVGNYSFTANATDSANPQNTGSQAITLHINQATTTTSVAPNAANTNPSVFQQNLTYTVTVTPQYGCVPTGSLTVYDGAQIPQNVIASTTLVTGNNGVFTFSTAALSVNTSGQSHSITAVYGGDPNFLGSNSNSTPLLQTVNKAGTTSSLALISPTPAFVGQLITVSWSLVVNSPGAGMPTIPTGTVLVTSTDPSTNVQTSCSDALASGQCKLPSPTTPGARTLSIAYSGDPNFMASAANGLNYNVYQLVFTTQPSNTVAGTTITPAVVVAAQDANGNTLDGSTVNNITLPNFDGPITVGIGTNAAAAHDGHLSGTTTVLNASNGVATFGDLSIDKVGNGYTLTASTGGSAQVPSSAFNVNSKIYYVDASGNFGALDLTSGTATPASSNQPSATGNTGMGLASGNVYVYNASNQLLQINPSDGSATQLGTGTIPDPTFTKSGARTTGDYYGLDLANGSLYSINRTDGTTAQSVPTQVPHIDTANCGYNASLSGSATTLYLTIAYTGESCPNGTAQADTLYVIDPTLGTTTQGVAITDGTNPVTGFIGSAFVDGKLYAFTLDNKEYVINVTNGFATPVPNTAVSTNVTGGALVPPPPPPPAP